VPITARKGDVLPKGFVFVIVPQFAIASSILIRIGKLANRGENMANATKSAATKRNNRKIHARKFLATPEGKAWLARKQEEREEIKLAREANTMF